MSNPPDKDDLIDISGDDNGDTDSDPCAPPPPRAHIFRENNRDPHLDFRDSTYRWEGVKRPGGKVDRDEKYDYQVPGKKHARYPWQTWINHPIIVAIIAATLIFCYFFLPDRSPLWWIVIAIALLIVPYWTYNWPRYRYRYNMEWEPDAEPTGCLYPSWRWWWWD